jgi:hypothetical protein
MPDYRPVTTGPLTIRKMRKGAREIKNPKYKKQGRSRG